MACVLVGSWLGERQGRDGGPRRATRGPRTPPKSTKEGEGRRKFIKIGPRAVEGPTQQRGLAESETGGPWRRRADVLRQRRWRGRVNYREDTAGRDRRREEAAQS